jgi:hypothetical protein
MKRILLVATMVAGALTVVGGSPAAAMTVKHETSSYDATIPWTCPGPNPIEHYTLSTQTTTFFVGGKRIRVIDHQEWRGWITNRETGERIRDAGNWNDVYTYEGNHVLRGVTTGAVWRFTVPGHGIVVQETGRSLFEQGSDSWETPFGGSPDVSALCPYV